MDVTAGSSSITKKENSIDRNALRSCIENIDLNPKLRLNSLQIFYTSSSSNIYYKNVF